jgi:uncharacterized protein
VRIRALPSPCRFLIGLSFAFGCGPNTDLLSPAEPNGCSRGLIAALDRRDSEAARALRKRGAIGACAETAERLFKAIYFDRESDLALLLDCGADPNRGPGESGAPHPLTLAFERRLFGGRSLNSLSALIQHGADRNHRDRYRWNPRQFSADAGGGDGHYQYDVELSGATLLIAASVAGDLALARLLIGAGADINARDAEGHTAFDYAEKSANSQMMDVLDWTRTR